MKELLIYSPIYSFTAESYITELDKNKSYDITARVNSPGGDVYGSYGMIAKFNEHPKAKKIKVDGQAKSAAFFICCAADEVECLNVSEFMVHRAAMYTWIERDPSLFTDSVKESLENTNKNLRAILESKIDAKTFKRVTGVSLDDVFSLDSRIDVEITAEQAKEMGLVNKINQLTGPLKNQIVALASTHGVAAFSTDPKIADTPITTSLNNNKMTLQEFQAQHPEVFAAAVKIGTDAERDRVGELMAYHDVDAAFVAKAISEGTVLSRAQTAELNRKAFAKDRLAQVSGDNPDEVTPELPEVKDDKGVQAFKEAVKANLKK